MSVCVCVRCALVLLSLAMDRGGEKGILMPEAVAFLQVVEGCVSGCVDE